MAKTPSALGQTQGEFPISRELLFAQTGSDPTGAWTQQESTSTSALVVGQWTMEQTSATLLNPRIVTPLVVSKWSLALQNTNLLQRYPCIPTFISLGTDAGIPTLSSTFAPLNHPSVDAHKEVFLEIVNNELAKGRYWGLFSKAEIKSIIGSFQTSPLSLIPKPSKPSKFCLIQNLSYPLITKSVQSINSSIVMDLYLCTWGTFATVATLIWSLPPGLLGTCGDVLEAYRIIPLA